MVTQVQLRNERTGEIKTIKVGWSWVLFLFSGVFGLPLFARRLYHYGAVMAGLSLATAVASEVDTSLYVFLLLSQLIASVQFGRKGNELTAKHYLENGWSWAEPDADTTEFAKQKWALA